MRWLGVGTTALLLAGCNMGDEPGKNDAGAALAPRPSAPRQALEAERRPAPTPIGQPEGEPVPEPAKADPRQVTRAWFAGKWTDSGDCAEAGEFAPSGIYQLADGTRGMWTVQDGRLVLQQGEGRTAVALRKVDDKVVEVTNEDGSVGRSTRC